MKTARPFSTYCRDDPIETTTEHRDREASLDENGNGVLHFGVVSICSASGLFYMTHMGNWTERIVSNPDGQNSNIERRAITYHALGANLQRNAL